MESQPRQPWLTSVMVTIFLLAFLEQHQTNTGNEGSVTTLSLCVRDSQSCHFFKNTFITLSTKIISNRCIFFLQNFYNIDIQVNGLQKCTVFDSFFISSHATCLCFLKHDKVEFKMAMCLDGNIVRALRLLRLACGREALKEYFTHAHVAGCVFQQSKQCGSFCMLT